MTTSPESSRKGIGGPKTAAGKKKISLNALKHGLYAASIYAQETIAEAIGVPYEEVLEKMRAHYKPADPVEELLVSRIARCAWRMLMTQTAEDKLVNTRGYFRASNDREEILKHERLVDIHLHRAIDALAKKRSAQKVLDDQNKLNPPTPPSSPHAQSDPEFVP